MNAVYHKITQYRRRPYTCQFNSTLICNLELRYYLYALCVYYHSFIMCSGLFRAHAVAGVTGLAGGATNKTLAMSYPFEDSYLLSVL